MNWMFVYTTAVLLAATPMAHARWATPDDVDYSVEYRDWEITVHKDGSFDEQIEDETLILKDSARMSRGVLRLNYNPEVSHLEIVQAETINKKSRIQVVRKLIEDKPLASAGEGFDQWRQVMIAFPGVDVGSRIHVKYRLKWHHVTTPGFFSSNFVYGGEFQKKGKLTIRSALPLFSEINDPHGVLAIDRSLTRIEVQLKAPVLATVIDEQDPVLSPSKLAFVAVATSRDWGAVIRTAAPLYEQILAAPLPESFQKIAVRARLISDPVQRMNSVTSQLADEIRYLGDWRTLKGQWVPRDLATIANTKFGDCKDFAISIASILRNLGMKADAAWVYRGWGPVLDSYNLPANYRFNHAITRVQHEGKDYWLDGTNIASYAQGVPGDIADRPALIIAPGAAQLMRTPAGKAEQFSYAFSQRMNFAAHDGIQVDAQFVSQGSDAVNWINGNFNTSQESLDFKLARAVARSEQIMNWRVDGFRLQSRVVDQLKAVLHYVDKAEGYRSTAGLSYPVIAPDGVERFMFPTDQRVSDLHLGELYLYEREMTLTGLSVVGRESLACALDSPWVEIRRSVTSNSEGVKILDRLRLKKSLITFDEYKTPQFAELQRKLVSCFRWSSVVYQPRKSTLD